MRWSTLRCSKHNLWEPSGVKWTLLCATVNVISMCHILWMHRNVMGGALAPNLPLGIYIWCVGIQSKIRRWKTTMAREVAIQSKCWYWKITMARKVGIQSNGRYWKTTMGREVENPNHGVSVDHPRASACHWVGGMLNVDIKNIEG